MDRKTSHSLTDRSCKEQMKIPNITVCLTRFLNLDGAFGADWPFLQV